MDKYDTEKNITKKSQDGLYRKNFFSQKIPEFL